MCSREFRRREKIRNTSPYDKPFPTHMPLRSPPHLILTRLPPNPPQSVTLPSHLHSSPLPSSTQYLPPSADVIIIKSHLYHGQGQDSDRYRRTEQSIATTDELILNCCNHDTDPLLDPPKGTDPKRGPLLGSETGSPNDVPPQLGDTDRGPENDLQKWTLFWGPKTKRRSPNYSKTVPARDTKSSGYCDREFHSATQKSDANIITTALHCSVQNHPVASRSVQKRLGASKSVQQRPRATERRLAFRSILTIWVYLGVS